MTATAAPGLTSREIQARLLQRCPQLLELLEEMEGDGLVTRRGSRWTLSDEAEARFGRALRGLTAINNDDERREG